MKNRISIVEDVKKAVSDIVGITEAAKQMSTKDLDKVLKDNGYKVNTDYIIKGDKILVKSPDVGFNMADELQEFGVEIVVDDEPKKGEKTFKHVIVGVK